MPNRSTRFKRSLLTGYGGVAVNILYSLVSIPLALSYLPREEFGLWALALQVNGYLALIDFGMSGAVGRFLADHKDDVNSNHFREHFSTGFLVFIVQGTVVAALGTVLSNFAPALLSIPTHLASDFRFLLANLCLIAAISILSRALASPLWAFQRMDVINLSGALGLIVQFFVMWLGFHMGFGVRSFVVASAATVLVSVLFYAWSSIRNGYLPSRRGWFRPRWPVFIQIFAYARDGMLLSIGSQLVNATQVTIVSRVLGLDAAANYAVATKLYGMCLMLFHKVMESAAPGLAEMYVRKQTQAFISRYWDAILLTLAPAIIGAVAITAGNSAFIALWTHGKIIWSSSGDALLGLMILAFSMSRTFITVFGVTKNLKPVRLLYFIEGLIFVPSAILAAKWFGVNGVLAASLAIHLLVTLLSSARAASKGIGSCRRLARPILAGLILITLAYLISTFLQTTDSTLFLRLGITILLSAISAIVVWYAVIPASTKSLMTERLKPSYR